MSATRLGKIEAIRLGFGGYQDAQFGLSITLSGDGWGVGDFKGHWSMKPSEHSQWTEADQDAGFAETMRFLLATLKDAKKQHLAELVGVPVEVVFDNMKLESWRVLKEVL